MIGISRPAARRALATPRRAKWWTLCALPLLAACGSCPDPALLTRVETVKAVELDPARALPVPPPPPIAEGASLADVTTYTLRLGKALETANGKLADLSRVLFPENAAVPK